MTALIQTKTMSVDFIPGAGHFCWEERPAEYADLVTDWWNRVNVHTTGEKA